MEYNKIKDKKQLQMMLWNATVGKVQELCSLDSRSLALLRVAVGITSLYDLYDRARDISAHYSDNGIISRNVVLNSLWSDYWFSLHMMTGNVNYISILFIVHTFIATSFLIGYRTRLSHVLLWVFTISLQTRNIIVGHSGDTLHVLVLLWMAFLPISKNWSVDAMLDPRNHNNRKTSSKNYVVTNVGAVAYMFQILVMYYAAHTLKVGSAWRVDRTAAYLALGLDFFRRPFGDILLMFPNILKLSTIGVLYWQMIGPYLYFSPILTGFCRSFVVFGFSCMHWGFGLAMRLGQFSFITCSGILGLFPGWGWDQIFNFFRTKRRVGFQLYYLQQCKACYWFARICETFLLLPDSHVRAVTSLRSEEDPCSCGGICEKDDQIWLSCQNYHGQFLYNFDALRELCYASPFLVPLSFIDFNKLLKFRALYKPAAFIRDYIHGGCHSEGSWASVNNSNSKKFNKLNDDIIYQVISMTYQVMRALIKNSIAALFLYIIFTRNASSVGSRSWNTPPSLYPLMYIFHLDQHWAMFTPSPPNQWWWYNIEGELGDHTKVELWANGAMFTHIPNIPHTFDKPPNNEVYLGFKNHRWFKFFENGYNHHQSYETFRLEFGRWICREYNNVHSGDQRLWKFNIHLMNEIDNNQHDGSRTFTGKQTLWSHLCYDQ